jgi:hypothetical protein
MKTIKVVLAALVISAFSFTSCSSDDEGSSTGGDLTAKWNPTKTIVKIAGEEFDEPYESNEPGCSKDYAEFTDEGDFNFVIYVEDPNTPGACVASPATPQTYTKSENTLVISGGQYGGTYTITRLTGSELRVKQTSTTGGITSETTIYLTKASS